MGPLTVASRTEVLFGYLGKQLVLGIRQPGQVGFELRRPVKLQLGRLLLPLLLSNPLHGDQEVVNIVSDLDTTCCHVLVDGTFALLPTPSPVPRLPGGHRDMGA
jgi:hypothetical protein